MKESLLFMSLAGLLIFEGFYVLANPTLASNIGIGTLLGFVVAGTVIGILVGLTALTVGLSETSIRILFISIVIFSLLFQFPLFKPFYVGTFYVSAPIGMGILYPTAWNVFVVAGDSSFMGYIGFMIMLGLSLLMLICAVLMGAGTHD